MAEPRIPARWRQIVAERAAGICEYCRSQSRFAMQPFSVEHIDPRSEAGESTLDNLALACQGCNNHKYTKVEGEDPVSGQVAPLFHPRRQRWSDHFRWSPDFSMVVGITPTGRATVEALRLNRSGVVNLRRVLYLAGEHPPAESSGGREPEGGER